MQRFLVLLAFFYLLVGGHSTLVAQDIKPLLKQLSTEQKLQVLEYMRDMGADLDQQLICAFEQLDAKNRAQTTKYLQAVQPQQNGILARTTVKWSKDTIRFAPIEEGNIWLDSVEVTNTGSTPYSIVNVQTACDCAVLNTPTKALLPGEKAMVRIEFNSKLKRGKVKTGIVLQDNSAPNARSIIYLQGEVIPRKKAKKRPWEN